MLGPTLDLKSSQEGNLQPDLDENEPLPDWQTPCLNPATIKTGL